VHHVFKFIRGSFRAGYWDPEDAKVSLHVMQLVAAGKFPKALVELRYLVESTPSGREDIVSSMSQKWNSPKSKTTIDFSQSVRSKFWASGDYISEAVNVHSITQRDGVYHWSNKDNTSSGAMKTDAYTCIGDIAIFFNIATPEGAVGTPNTVGSKNQIKQHTEDQASHGNPVCNPEQYDTDANADADHSARDPAAERVSYLICNGYGCEKLQIPYKYRAVKDVNECIFCNLRYLRTPSHRIRWCSGAGSGRGGHDQTVDSFKVDDYQEGEDKALCIFCANSAKKVEIDQVDSEGITKAG
jgi:hypothetical protein